MGTTLVYINEEPTSGFWMRDSLLELWLRFAALHIDDPTEPGLANTIRDQWLLASRGFFNGHVPHGLEEFGNMPEGRKIIEQAIRALDRHLSPLDGVLNGRVLSLMGCGGDWRDVEVWRLKEINRAMLDLLAGEIEYDPSSTGFMPGCRDEPCNESDWPV